MKKQICKTCNEKESRGNCGLCDCCRLKKWRRDNPQKVKDYYEMRYERDRVKAIALYKKWYGKNKRHVYEYNKMWTKKNRDKMAGYYRNYRNQDWAKQLTAIRQMTNKIFGHLKTRCSKCPSTIKIEFHHPEPISVDNFMILCKGCHMKEHGKGAVITYKD